MLWSGYAPILPCVLIFSLAPILFVALFWGRHWKGHDTGSSRQPPPRQHGSVNYSRRAVTTTTRQFTTKKLRPRRAAAATAGAKGLLYDTLDQNGRRTASLDSPALNVKLRRDGSTYTTTSAVLPTLIISAAALLL